VRSGGNTSVPNSGTTTTNGGGPGPVKWSKYVHVAACRREDHILSALLAAQFALIFIAEPLAFKGFAYPVIATGIIAAGLILLLVLGSHQRGALLVVVIGGIRLLAGAADFLWHTSFTEGAEAVSAVLALLVVLWAVFRIVFRPGHITWHRVRGAVVLYLTTAILFAWLYILIAEILPNAFSGLMFRATHGALSPFLYYSLTALTTLGLGDITPLDAFARNLTMLEAVIGQLFPVIILGRILTLYANERISGGQSVGTQDSIPGEAMQDS
jgi:Ion channel